MRDAGCEMRDAGCAVTLSFGNNISPRMVVENRPGASRRVSEEGVAAHPASRIPHLPLRFFERGDYRHPGGADGGE